jgi:predicted transcriptional regulator
MSPEQCRAARSWFGWSQGELAKRAGLSLSTVKDFEAGNRKPILNNRNAILHVLEGAGVRFFDADGEIGIAVTPKAGVEA